MLKKGNLALSNIYRKENTAKKEENKAKRNDINLDTEINILLNSELYENYLNSFDLKIGGE